MEPIKISDLIDTLTNIKEEHGDLDVYFLHQGCDAPDMVTVVSVDEVDREKSVVLLED